MAPYPGVVATNDNFLSTLLYVVELLPVVPHPGLSTPLPKLPRVYHPWLLLLQALRARNNMAQIYGNFLSLSLYAPVPGGGGY